MKTILLSIMAVVFLLPGCVKAQQTESKTENNSKILIVYYSRSGNTKTVANYVQKLTGADMFRIETVATYPEGYHETTEVAKEEKNNNARPEIKSKVENLDQYDTVFIGFPIWWGTFPMAIATFMDSHNFDGKTVIPFCTHGGGGVDQGFTDLRKLSPSSNYTEGLSLSGSQAASSNLEVEKWLRKIKVID